jgi:phosphatidylserine decarboxylase
MKIVDRKTKEERTLQYSGSVIFLYTSVIGRGLLKLVTCPFVSNIVGKYMNSRLSKRRINKTVKTNNIDMNLYEEKEYQSFNDFFTRRKKNLNFDNTKDNFISPCDSKILAIRLNKDSSFDIKGSRYNLKTIINEDITNKYNNGYALIFRLEITDYHRYHFIDDGTLDQYKFIKGKLNTVQPIAYNKKIFHTNSREYTTLHTKNFGDIIEVDVGALCVGKITNNKEITSFKKGDEKGYFEFGGSTIILFVEDKRIIIDKDILENSKLFKETVISCGEKIGIKYK